MNETKDSSSPKESARVSVASQKTMTFAGPLPPPSVLQQYGEIEASYPERIIAMAEKEQNAVHTLQKETFALERKLMEEQLRTVKKGQIYAFILAI